MTENIQTDPREIVRTFASCMATLGVNNLYSQGHPVLVMGIEHAHHIASADGQEERKAGSFRAGAQPVGGS